MRYQVLGIFCLSLINMSCVYRQPIELKEQASHLIEVARESKIDSLELKQAEELFEYGEESEKIQKYGAATRAYKDVLETLKDIENKAGDEFEVVVPELKVSIDPSKFRQAKAPKIRDKENPKVIKPPVKSAPKPVEGPTTEKSSVESIPVEESPKKIAVLPKQEVRGFPEARSIEELKKEGISDLSKKPKDEANQRATALLFKQKLPGVIAYSFGAAEFQSSSLVTLEKIFVNLKGDPKANVMFQAQMAQGEDFGLMDRRFELLQAFFNERGIDPGRLAMDDKRMVGDWPEIRIFILH